MATNQKVFKARPMNSVSPFDSQVDIVIPFHGQYDLVTTLLDSLFRLTRSNYYQVILVDDFSGNDKFVHGLKQNARKNAEAYRVRDVMTAVQSDRQLGYAGACKLGYDVGESPYVCFLNSDCVIQDMNWLRRMGESLLNLKQEGVRVIAPKVDNAVGGDPAQEGELSREQEPDVIISDNSFLTLPCFMCHRELFPRIGGFLREYPFGYFEDEEFAARLRKNGYKQAVCRTSFVHHKGQATIRSVWRNNPQVRDVMEHENRERCIQDIKNLRN